MINPIVGKSALLPAFLIMAIICQAQPAANFNATPVSGCTPLLVNFHDLTTGNPTSWKWDLGNGTISFLQHPSVTYFNPGQYTVKLIVQNAGGKDSIIRQQFITVYALPQPGFSAPVRSGCYPLPISFRDESIAGSGTVIEWFWDFGDGTTATVQHPTHTYTSPGNFNVSLRVKNSNGCTKTITKTQYIHINEGVHADFSHVSSNSCAAPAIVSFTNLSTGTGTLNFLWNFGDGGTSVLPNPTHTYSGNGSYTISLIVTNSTGCKDTIIKPNLVSLGNRTAFFHVPDSFCVQAPQLFLNSSVPAPSGVSWDFGDGSFSNAIQPVKTYTVPGDYTVKLVCNFGGCPDSISKQVRVLPKPESGFSASPQIGCKAPMPVQFTNNSISGITYKWYFGDGESSALFQPNHIYLNPGSYTVTLISTNTNGCSDTLVKNNFISIKLPVAGINNLFQEGCAPFSWTFTSSFSSSEPAQSYWWDFGDGSTSTLASPTHVFDSGVYDIRLAITTAGGCTDTVIVRQGIRVGVKPHTAFSADPRDACARTAINFTDSSTGTITRWHWEFGDGSTSSAQHPSHEYNDTGYFTVRLIVYNNGCADTLEIEDYIHINPPIAKFNLEFNCDEPLKRIFNDASIGADEWHWDFGDGNYSTLQNPIHSYASPGIYSVKLTVKNNRTGCEHETSSDLQVVITDIDFTASQAAICRNSAVNFVATGSFAGVTNFEWDFGDGQNGTGPSPSHTYIIAGVYTVKLKVTDLLGCTDSVTKQNNIRVFGPVSNFNPQVTNTCRESGIIFNDLSTGDGINPINQWIWHYGDGHSDTLSAGPFQHSYNTAGIFSVTLIVRDTRGCEDQQIKTNLLTISRPVAAFVASDTISCPGKQIQFTNQSTGPGLQYYWSFGDGSSSNSAQPSHSYNADGNYTVKLVITDQFGCTDSLVKPFYIKIITPIARFTVSDSVGSCPPLIVQFTDFSENVLSVNWDFGDGSSAVINNPVHVYNIPGTYMARLTVTGRGGCVSTMQKIIKVSGPYGSFNYGALKGCKPLTVNFQAATTSRSSFIWDFNDGTTQSGLDSNVSHTYTIPGIYVPKMILVDASGCTVAIPGRDSIIVHGTTAGFSTNTNLLCDSGRVVFTNTTVSSDEIIGYTWHFGDGTSSNTMSPSHIYNVQGRYFPSLVVHTRLGCTDSVANPVTIIVVKKPELEVTKSPDGCLPLQVSFNSRLLRADTSAIQYRWQFGNGNSSVLAQPTTQSYNLAGNYPVNIIATNSSGCADTATLLVKAFNVPVTSVGADTFICKGKPRLLQATGAQNYSWSPSAGLSCSNCASPLASPQTSQVYIVTGTNADGCSSKDTISIDVVAPFKMKVTPAETICAGSSTRLTASGAANYTWSPATGLNYTNRAMVTAKPGVSTIYRVIGEDEKKCFSDTVFIPVKVYPVPTVDAGEDQTINGGQTADLLARVSRDVTQATWTPTGTITRNAFPAITVQPRVTTTYHVEVSNAGGCRASDDVTVHVICNGTNVFIPNTFSPNGDGKNEIFYPRGSGLFSIKSFKVFNRWGEIVFQKNDFKANDERAGWDGSYKGKPMNIDVFIYTMEVLCDNNTTLTYKGNIALVK